MSNESQYQFVNPEWLEHRPHTREDERLVTPLTSSNPPCFTTQIAEIMEAGFTIIECSTEPSAEEIASVINAFELACFRDITGSEGPTIHCIGAGESERYLRTGLEDEVSLLSDGVSQWLISLVDRDLRRTRIRR